MSTRYVGFLLLNYLLFINCQETVNKIYNDENNEVYNRQLDDVPEEKFIKHSANLCVGCNTELNKDVKGVDTLVNTTLRHVETENEKKHVLIKILGLQRQVVAGVKYTLLVEIGETLCPKDTTEELCELDASKPTKTCLVTFLEKPWEYKDKFIINNNCTSSQEYRERQKTIDVDDIKATGEKQLNIEDLESQIIKDEVVPVITHLVGSEQKPSVPVSNGSPLKSIKDITADFIKHERGEHTQSYPDNIRPTEERITDIESQILTEDAPKKPYAYNEDRDEYFNKKYYYKTLPDSVQRKKRSVSPLEKVTPEERNLVRQLAEFTASTLDEIDEDNHKRIVLQVLGAKKTSFSDGTLYHLTLRMGVSKCLEDKYDEQCSDKLFVNLTKICKVQVLVNEDNSDPKIVKSQCQTIKKDDSDINRTTHNRFKRESKRKWVKELIYEGLSKLDSRSDHENKYKVVDFSFANKLQNGYQVGVTVQLSDCLKSNDVDPRNCGVLPDSKAKFCTITMGDGPDAGRPAVECRNRKKVSKRAVLGGQREVEDPSVLKDFLVDGLSHLDAQSGMDNKLKVIKVNSATKQVVAGTLYRIKAEIAPSNCSKNGAETEEQCTVLSEYPPKECNFVIWDRPWLPNGRQTLNVSCAEDAQLSRSKREDEYIDLNKAAFDKFLLKHGKVYGSKGEYSYRLKVFAANMKIAGQLNDYEEGTAVYGASPFADLTQAEFRKTHLGLRLDLAQENHVPLPYAGTPNIQIPQAFDWRSKSVVTEVKDQGQCGSCWAFSVTGNVEGQYAIKYGKLLEFSEQELVDCDTLDAGCNGGLMDNAYREIEKLGGLETEQDYPYDAEDERCHFNTTLEKVQLSGAVNISHNETDMAKWLVQNGPISIGINANAMQLYMGGVSHPWKTLCNPEELDHGVLIVGYGVDSFKYLKKSLPFWIVKNSWGKSWGEQGYYRVYRGDGTCGLNQTPSSAIVA